MIAEMLAPAEESEVGACPYWASGKSLDHLDSVKPNSFPTVPPRSSLYAVAVVAILVVLYQGSFPFFPITNFFFASPSTPIIHSLRWSDCSYAL